MEASVAAEGAPPEATTQEAPSAPQVDLSPVTEQLGTLMERLGRVEQHVVPPQTQDDPNPLASLEQLLGGGEPEADPYAQQGEVSGPALLQALGQMNEQLTTSQQQAFQEQLEPVLADLQQLRLERDADALVMQYPDLGKPEVYEPVVAKARQMAEQLGNPELSTRASFIEVVYQAEMARKYAAGEVPAGSQSQPGLEAPNGGAPGSAEGPDMAERFRAARNDNTFWGR